VSAPTTTGGRIGRYAVNLYAALAMFYLFIPIIWIVVFSFNKPAGKFNFVWQEFTLDNWSDPFRDEALTDALVVSLQIALVSTLIATVLGSLIAIAITRYSFRGGSGIGFFLILPLTTPEVVIGASLLTLFIGADVDRNMRTVIIAHVMFQVSFVALTVRARARGFDFTLEQAAQDLGATPMRTFWKITFPLLLPGIAAAALLSFALSIDDFIITLFNAGSTSTFPLYINALRKVSFSPQINVLATIILLASTILLVVGSARAFRSERRAAGG
jgi:spermidine/putrescine transport system permease protein